MEQYQIKSEISGSIWKIMVEEGDSVVEDDELAILESMKMEIPVLSDENGVVKEIKIKEGNYISEGETILILQI